MSSAGGITVKVRGFEEAKRKLGPELIAEPARNFLSRAGTDVQGNSHKRAPHDRGRLVNSIAVEIDTAQIPLWARIGPDVGVYGIVQEEGTRPFWPPVAPLEAWGARKGLSPQQVFLVRRAISLRGIKPKHYMRDGLNDTLPKIPGFVELMAAEIEAGMK